MKWVDLLPLDDGAEPPAEEELSEPPCSLLSVNLGDRLPYEAIRKRFEGFDGIRSLQTAPRKVPMTTIIRIKCARSSQACRIAEEVEGRKLWDHARPAKVLMVLTGPDFKNQKAEIQEFTQIHVNIPATYSEDDLRNVFKVYGDIVNIVVQREETKVVALIDFTKASQAALAIEECDKSYNAVWAKIYILNSSKPNFFEDCPETESLENQGSEKISLEHKSPVSVAENKPPESSEKKPMINIKEESSSEELQVNKPNGTKPLLTDAVIKREPGVNLPELTEGGNRTGSEQASPFIKPENKLPESSDGKNLTKIKVESNSQSTQGSKPADFYYMSPLNKYKSKPRKSSEEKHVNPTRDGASNQEVQGNKVNVQGNPFTKQENKVSECSGGQIMTDIKKEGVDGCKFDGFKTISSKSTTEPSNPFQAESSGSVLNQQTFIGKLNQKAFGGIQKKGLFGNKVSCENFSFKVKDEGFTFKLKQEPFASKSSQESWESKPLLFGQNQGPLASSKLPLFSQNQSPLGKSNPPAFSPSQSPLESSKPPVFNSGEGSLGSSKPPESSRSQELQASKPLVLGLSQDSVENSKPLAFSSSQGSLASSKPPLFNTSEGTLGSSKPLAFSSSQGPLVSSKPPLFNTSEGNVGSSKPPGNSQNQEPLASSKPPEFGLSQSPLGKSPLTFSPSQSPLTSSKPPVFNSGEGPLGSNKFPGSSQNQELLTSSKPPAFSLNQPPLGKRKLPTFSFNQESLARSKPPVINPSEGSLILDSSKRPVDNSKPLAFSPSQGPLTSSQSPAFNPSQGPLSSSQSPAFNPSHGPLSSSQSPAFNPSHGPLSSSQSPAFNPSQGPLSSSQAPAFKPSQGPLGNTNPPACSLSQGHMESSKPSVKSRQPPLGSNANQEPLATSNLPLMKSRQEPFASISPARSSSSQKANSYEGRETSSLISAVAVLENHDIRRQEFISKRLLVESKFPFIEEQLFNLFDLIPGLESCEIQQGVNRNHVSAVIQYSNIASAIYARYKLHDFEHPFGNRLIVTFTEDGNDKAALIKEMATQLVMAQLSRVTWKKPSDHPCIEFSGENIPQQEFKRRKDPDARSISVISTTSRKTSSGDLRDMSSSSSAHVQDDPEPPPRKKIATPDTSLWERLFIVFNPHPLPEDILHDIFSRFGNFINTYLIPHKNVGYAMFSSGESARDAVTALHGRTVNGVKLKVILADVAKKDFSNRQRTY